MKKQGFQVIFGRKKAVTLTEIMIVFTLSTLVLLAASKIMTGTRRSFKKGSDMLNTQLMTEAIIGRLTSDVRSMTEKGSDEGKKFTMKIRERGGYDEEEITYTFDNKTLTRETSKGKKTNFHAEGKIANCTFKWIDPAPTGGKPDPGYLCVLLYVESDDPGEGKASLLPLVCMLSPKCTKGYVPGFLQ